MTSFGFNGELWVAHREEHQCLKRIVVLLSSTGATGAAKSALFGEFASAYDSAATSMLHCTTTPVSARCSPGSVASCLSPASPSREWISRGRLAAFRRLIANLRACRLSHNPGLLSGVNGKVCPTGASFAGVVNSGGTTSDVGPLGIVTSY